jgi:methyl-accepting chemotaxis protein
MRAGMASTHVLAAEDQGQFQATLTASHQAGEWLASLREAAADPARIQRLCGAAVEALSGFQTASGGLQAPIATRNQSEAALLIAAQRGQPDTAGVSEAAQASGRAANNVLGVARELSTQATTLRAAMDGFPGKVRAA